MNKYAKEDLKNTLGAIATIIVACAIVLALVALLELGLSSPESWGT